MPKENENTNNQNDNVVEIKGKKYTVTPEFKKDIDGHIAELTTKVKATESQVTTLSERIAALSKKPVGAGDDDLGGDDDDAGVEFSELMDRPQAAIDKAVQRALKKAGLPTKASDIDALEKKLEMKQMQQKYWDSFYSEHSYFSEDEHDFLIKGVTQKLMPIIKDLPVKEGRKKIAETVAGMMGRAIKAGKLEIATESKHKPANGMVLESADGGTVDNTTDGDNTTVNERTGSMADIVRNSPRSPYSTKKKGGTK